MTIPQSRKPTAARADLDDSAYRFWRWLPSHSSPSAALFGFLFTIAAFSLLFILINPSLKDILRSANIQLRGIDVFKENGTGAYILNDYLRNPPDPQCRQVAVIGASYTTTTAEPKLDRRLDQALARDLTVLTKQRWCGTSLGTNGLDTWSNFYIARLVRNRRPPDVLVVGMDWLDEGEGNRWLVLATGSGTQLLSSRELLPVVPFNQQQIYRKEAVFQEKLATLIPFLDTFRRSRPRGLLSGIVRLAQSGFRIPTSQPVLHGQSWKDSPPSRRVIEKLRHQKPRPLTIGPVGEKNLKMLGEELAKCRAAGIQVLVVTLPRNPVVPLDVSEASKMLNQWAERYQLALVNLWESKMVPTEFFTDTAHFFGEGIDLVSVNLASKIKESQP